MNSEELRKQFDIEKGFVGYTEDGRPLHSADKWYWSAYSDWLESKLLNQVSEEEIEKDATQFYLKQTGWESIGEVEEFDSPKEVIKLMVAYKIQIG